MRARGSFYRVRRALASPLLLSGPKEETSCSSRSSSERSQAESHTGWWGDEIRRLVDSGTFDLRKRAADTLKQAEAVVESASETIGQTIHAGQEVMRPAARSSLRSAK